MITMRVKGMLEARAHQHLRAILEDLRRAVAVVHVEIKDGDPGDFRPRKRHVCAHGNAVEQTETHGRITLRVVAWRPHRAEGALIFTVENGIDRVDHGAGGHVRRLQRVRAEGGIRIHLHEPLGGRQRPQVLKVRRVVDPGDDPIHGGCCRSQVELREQAGAAEVLGDGPQSIRPLGMARQHLVGKAGFRRVVEQGTPRAVACEVRSLAAC